MLRGKRQNILADGSREAAKDQIVMEKLSFCRAPNINQLEKGPQNDTEIYGTE